MICGYARMCVEMCDPRLDERYAEIHTRTHTLASSRQRTTHWRVERNTVRRRGPEYAHSDTQECPSPHAHAHTTHIDIHLTLALSAYQEYHTQSTR